MQEWVKVSAEDGVCHWLSIFKDRAENEWTSLLGNVWCQCSAVSLSGVGAQEWVKASAEDVLVPMGFRFQGQGEE